MPEKPISDKALIKLFLKAKGIKRQPFCSSLGFSKSFLDGDNTLTVENFRKMLQHPDFEDFDLAAFMKQQPELIKAKGELSSALSNHTFIMEAVKKLTEMRRSDEAASSEDVNALADYLEQAISKLSELSEDYQSLFHDFQKLYKAIERES